MPEPDESSHEALRRLDKRLDAFETGRRKTSQPRVLGGDAGIGYRLVGQMLGGVFGGIGLGWLVDHLAHTSPWGLVGGMLIGAGTSIYSAVRMAARASARASGGLHTGTPAPDPGADDDED